VNLPGVLVLRRPILKFLAAASILGCGDTKVNKINGLEITRADKSGVCLSNGKGCGDCFGKLDHALDIAMLIEDSKDDNDFESTCN
jgi:hypothetical protein